jgi:dihydropteroate synthase
VDMAVDVGSADLVVDLDSADLDSADLDSVDLELSKIISISEPIQLAVTVERCIYWDKE